MNLVDPLAQLTTLQPLAVRFAWYACLLLLFALITWFTATFFRVLVEDVFGPLVLRIKVRREFKREITRAIKELDAERLRKRTVARERQLASIAHIGERR